jgi:hypothetical protein
MEFAHLPLVAHEPLRNGIDLSVAASSAPCPVSPTISDAAIGVPESESLGERTGWKIASSAIPAEPAHEYQVNNDPIKHSKTLQCDVPDPNNLARFDSFSRPAAIGGDIVCLFYGVWKKSKRNGTPRRNRDSRIDAANRTDGVK